jgi:hypothetical protein
MERLAFHFPRQAAFGMPKFKLIPLPHGDDSPGKRLAHIRRERGLTQIELAEETGLVQTLLRFATAPEVSAPEALSR